MSTIETNLEAHKSFEHVKCEDMSGDKFEETLQRESDYEVHVNKKHDKIPSQIQNQRNIVMIENATFYCETCGKDFDEFDLLAKHTEKQHGKVTGEKRGNCDKSFRDSQGVEKHAEEEHTTIKNINLQESKQCDSECSLCSKIIRTSLGVQRHEELYCNECEKCSPERVSFDIHKQLHKIKPILKCEKCEFTTIDEPILKSHIQTTHKVIKIDMKVTEPIEFKCDECEYKCKLNIQLKKHKKSVHVEEGNAMIQCDQCEFGCIKVAEFITHLQIQRGSNAELIKCKSCDYKALSWACMTTLNMLCLLVLLQVNRRGVLGLSSSQGNLVA